MFDFAPVGAGVAAVGILFIVAGGGRLIPRRKGHPQAINNVTSQILQLKRIDVN